MGFSTIYTDVTRTGANYAAPDIPGTAASVTVSVTSGQKVLVTLATLASHTKSDLECWMSFQATGAVSYDPTSSGLNLGNGSFTNGVGWVSHGAGAAPILGRMSSVSAPWVLTAT